MEEEKKPANEPSPCLTCTRVKDPRKCENKNCKTWGAWFAARWSYSTELIIQNLKERGSENESIKFI